MTLTATDFFCGAGGSSQGTVAVPGVSISLAANHWEKAIETHALNFRGTDHFQGDIHEADVARFPRTDLFWASPECPQWSQARGKQRDYDKQPDLFGEVLPDAAADRSRALMWDVPKYLEAMKTRGRPVLAGVVENVVDVRAWIHWQEWVQSIRNLGYKTKLVALNSMHAQPVRTLAAPQSRDRLYLCYWRESIRTPDWNKWLRPQSWCPACEEWVGALQVFKKQGTDMGRYRQQYVYRCPRVTCRNSVIEPPAQAAAEAIDWKDLGTRIGDRPRPMKPATRARIEAGLRKYAVPITLEAAGNTYERRPGVRTWPVSAPVTTQSATPTKALAVPPLIVPAGGTWREEAVPVASPLAARTTRENDGLAIPPFLVPIRSGRPRTIPVTEPTATIVADGSGHGLAVPSAMLMRNNGSRGDGGEHCTPLWEPARTLTSAGHQSLVSWEHLLVPYYGNAGSGRPVTEPVGTLSTRDRYGLATGNLDLAIDDVLFRMLKPGEIGRAMAFYTTYVVVGNQREQVRQYGNAVTPPVAEILYSALVEAITGTPLDRELTLAA